MNERIDYTPIIKKHAIKPHYLKNVLQSFFFGGLLGIFGELLIFIYRDCFAMEEAISRSLMSVTLIFLASLFTALGLYDRFGQLAKAGSVVPITGFSNSMTSAAIEYRTEGIILGIAANMFKLAGSVIVLGVVSGYIFSMIRYLVNI